MVNSLNNPTGVTYSEATLDVIAWVAAREDLWVISDEVYDSQVWEGRHLSRRAVPGMAERTLVVGSLSKGHGMTGSRLGWVVGPAEAIGLLGDLGTVSDYGLPGFVQEGGRCALALGADFKARIAAPFARRREVARRLLGDEDVVRAAPMAGAMYALLNERIRRLSEAFALRRLEEERVAVMPGGSFGNGAAGHVRVAMTVDDDAFANALAQILALAARLAAEAGTARSIPA